MRSEQEIMAEREGFEPPIPFQVWPLSRRLVSTAHAPLRVKSQSALEAEFCSRFHSSSRSVLLFTSEPPCPEKVTQQGRTVCFKDTAHYFHFVIESRMIQDIDCGFNRAALRIAGSVDETLKPCMNH